MKWRPRFSAGWGAAISLVGFAAATLAHATALRVVFALLILGFLVFLGGRALARWRDRLLWRLRHRLLAAYLFIGLIPVVLLVLIGLVLGWTLYGKVAVYVVTERLERLQAELQDLTSDVVASFEVASSLEGKLRPETIARIVDAHTVAARDHLAAVEVEVLDGPLPADSPLPIWLRGQRFSGVLVSERAELVTSQVVPAAAEPFTVVLVLPLDEKVLPYLGRDIGRVSLTLLGEERSGRASPSQRLFPVGDKSYPVLWVIEDRRPLPPPLGWWDSSLVLAASQPTHQKETGKPGPPLVLSVQSRIALVHRQLSYRLGEFSGLPFTVFTAFAVLFFVLDLVALWTGVKLTRTITGAVNDLQVATEQVKAGNFSHRIRLRGRDQLSGLADAFNSMTSSIERLIEESNEKQRLQNELEIARQVQEQLFPRHTPHLETLELVARCRPARTVSGDYYDYGLAAPGKLVFTIGDISGKGISAALLMATIQSILRSHGYASRLTGPLGQLSPAELVKRVNRQLCATTSPEKYSTLFVGIYDDSARRLTYTNAGHLPPVILSPGRREELGVGGTVVGLFSDLHYEEATIQLQPGDWLVAYTDGLTEVENSYEEEYGNQRLVAFLERTADNLSPERLVEAVLVELQQWAPGIEPMDDRTVLVARVR
ncbi:MAG: PP2C family protein-serine/threonine phosphatase [Terriglobia bacterium]